MIINNIIEINNLSVKYGSKYALNNISLNIRELDFVGIIGPNGGGKTTLLKSILGLIKTEANCINILGCSANETSKIIGYVPQHSNLNRMFPLTVKEVVAMSTLPSKLTLFKTYKKNDYLKIYDILYKVGILNLKDQQVSDLSEGEFQKVLIARALAVDPKILILDEPTSSLDIKSRIQIFNLLEDLNKNVTIILVTHDLEAISTRIKKLICLNEFIVYQGESKINEEILKELYGSSFTLKTESSI